ncbi:hypothetical protein [Lysobacter gummosus]|uniref:hypothetical protein n=1 Tax=Lysobacter gummosus TaxID=262324 RepID=UPI003635FEB4
MPIGCDLRRADRCRGRSRTRSCLSPSRTCTCGRMLHRHSQAGDERMGGQWGIANY